MFDKKRPDPIRERARGEMDSIIRRQIEAMRQANAEKKAREDRNREGR